MVTAAGGDERVAELSARVAALESALAQRSRQIVVLQSTLDAHDLANLARIEAGLAPLPRGPFYPRTWRESTQFRPGRVLPTLRALWAATAADKR